MESEKEFLGNLIGEIEQADNYDPMVVLDGMEHLIEQRLGELRPLNAMVRDFDEEFVNKLVVETVRGTFDFIKSDEVFVTDKDTGDKINDCEINGNLKNGTLFKALNKRLGPLGYKIERNA